MNVYVPRRIANGGWLYQTTNRKSIQIYVKDFWECSVQTFQGRLFDAFYDRGGIMRVNKEKHTELVKHVKQLLKVNSFALLKGRLSMEYVNLLFSHDSFTTCLDRAKIDQNIYLNTFFIDILQAPVIF